MLLPRRRMPAPAVIAGIRAALEAGTCSPDVVAVEARKHAATSGGAAPDSGREAAWPALERPLRSAAVITLPRRNTAPPADGRAAPSVAIYDQLLTRPPAGTQGGAS